MLNRYSKNIKLAEVGLLKELKSVKKEFVQRTWLFFDEILSRVLQRKIIRSENKSKINSDLIKKPTFPVAFLHPSLRIFFSFPFNHFNFLKDFSQCRYSGWNRSNETIQFYLFCRFYEPWKGKMEKLFRGKFSCSWVNLTKRNFSGFCKASSCLLSAWKHLSSCHHYFWYLILSWINFRFVHRRIKFENNQVAGTMLENDVVACNVKL